MADDRVRPHHREQDCRILLILEKRFRNTHQEQNTRIFSEVRIPEFMESFCPEKGRHQTFK
ncbi:unnamed protein product [Ixodes pacificus]